MSNYVTLKYPVTVGGKTHSSLTLRRAKAKDFLAGDAVTGELRKSYAIYASICDVTLDVIYELDAEDMAALGTAAEAVLGNVLGQAGGPS